MSAAVFRKPAIFPSAIALPAPSRTMNSLSPSNKPFFRAPVPLAGVSGLPTPRVNHFTEADYGNFYEPAEDSFLLLDALEADAGTIKQLHPAVAAEIGCAPISPAVAAPPSASRAKVAASQPSAHELTLFPPTSSAGPMHQARLRGGYFLPGGIAGGHSPARGPDFWAHSGRLPPRHALWYAWRNGGGCPCLSHPPNIHHPKLSSASTSTPLRWKPPS